MSQRLAGNLMNNVTIGATATVVSYLFGSIPFGLLIAKTFVGIDIRQQGSGNIGATNIARVLGARWGILVLLLDCCKGLFPVLLLPSLLMDDPCIHLGVLCGIATIVGHMFPCWLKFRGGKGVATALGVIVVLGPWATLIAFSVFLLTFLATRIVSLGSILAAISFSITQMVMIQPSPFSAESWSLGIFSLAVPLLIIIRHRSNVGRLLRGEEAKLSLSSEKAKEELAEPTQERRDEQQDDPSIE